MITSSEGRSSAQLVDDFLVGIGNILPRFQERGRDRPGVFLDQMDVPHGLVDALVTEPALKRPRVDAQAGGVRGHRVAQGVPGARRC